MRAIILILTLFLASVSLAINDSLLIANADVKVGANHKIGVGFSAAPIYLLMVNEVEFSSYYDYFIEPEGFRMSYAADVNIAIGQKASITTGLAYSNRDIIGKVLTYTHNGYTLPADYSKTLKFRYLDLPVQFKYQFINKKMGLFAEGGLTFNYLLKNPVDQLGQTIVPNKFNFNMNVAIGANYNLTNNLNLTMQTGYSQAILKNNRQQYKSIDFRIGAMYYFN